MNAFLKNTKFFFLVVLFSFAFGLGIKGIDYGAHWDEPKLVNSVIDSVNTGLFLPRWYNYPSVPYDIALIGTLLHSPNHELALEHNSSDDKLLTQRLRALFLFVSLCSGIWVFLLVYTWKRNIYEALLATAILFSSWEFNYHARWIAPDGLMMQFGILSILFMYLAIINHSAVLLRLAAITVGLTCSSKYPGGLFVLPLIYTAYLLYKDKSVKYTEFLAVTFIFLLSFVLTTPGTFVEPFKFIEDVLMEIHHYGAGHGGYTVEGIEHTQLMSEYIALVMFSKYMPIAFSIFIFILIGIYQTIRYEPAKISILILMFPILYFAYFSMQKVMIVRNILVLIPFFAVFAARGIWMLGKISQNKSLARLLFLLLYLFLSINYWWLYNAADSIANRTLTNHEVNILNYLSKHNTTKVFLHHEMNNFVTPSNLENVSNMVYESREADAVMFPSSAITAKEWYKWIVNRRNIYTTVSGIYEVNWDYYASWFGDVRILAVKRDIAEHMGLL